MDDYIRPETVNQLAVLALTRRVHQVDNMTRSQASEVCRNTGDRIAALYKDQTRPGTDRLSNSIRQIS